MISNIAPLLLLLVSNWSVLPAIDHGATLHVDPTLAATVGLQPYRFLSNTTAFPDDIWLALQRSFGEATPLFAEPTAPFSDGCLPEPGLPRRRLILAAISPRYAVIHFVEGGFAPTSQAALVLRTESWSVVLGVAITSFSYPEPEALLRAIRSGSLWT